MGEETHWADDVYQYFYPKDTIVFRDCEYCGSERTIPLRVIGTKEFICESCATLSKEEREGVRRHKDDQPIPYVLNEERCQPCQHPRYDGSTWDYCGEGFKLYWKDNRWIAECIKSSEKWNSNFPIHSDPLDLDLEEDGFWKLIEYGCCSTSPSAVKPKKNVSLGWDPYGL